MSNSNYFLSHYERVFEKNVKIYTYRKTSHHRAEDTLHVCSLFEDCQFSFIISRHIYRRKTLLFLKTPEYDVCVNRSHEGNLFSM